LHTGKTVTQSRLPAPSTNNLNTLVRDLLDRGYGRAAGATLRAVGVSVTEGIVAQRLRELDAEAARLAAVGERLNSDNPVLRALLADLDTALRRDARRMDADAGQAQAAGIDAAARLTRELALRGIDREVLIAAGVNWQTPDPEAVNALVNYATSTGWADELRRYPARVRDTVFNQALRGMVEGWSAEKTAREVRRVAEGMSVAQANTLLRTLMLHSYRDASAIHARANADILTGQIRIATLDDRTCLACIAEHGTRMAVGERVLDHHAGRCVALPEVRGRPRSVQTGEDWFASLDEERARRVAGDAAYEALRSGRATLRDFVQPYQDRTFGAMIRQASVSNLLNAR
jgi:hypothetical protein